MINIQMLIVGFIAAFIIGILISPPLISFFKRLKCGQEIRDEGPCWHESKSGTPTMGGMIFILASAIPAIIVSNRNLVTIMLIFLSVSFGVVGFVDDFIKVKFKRNLGLTELQKLGLQIVASCLFVWVLKDTLINTPFIIPFTNISINLGIWYLPLSVIVIISSVNAVNLTDGLDGLASSVTTVVAIFFTIISLITKNIPVSIFGSTIIGGTGAFLIFNKFPAKIFMGDTGSLFLGGALAGMAILTGTPLFLLIAGGILVIEALSVIIQVGVYKLTKKRVFKMAPIHHHFEMSGFKEQKIVIIFTLCSLLLCIIAYGGFLVHLS
ncbi:MAG: phospho-N-acetylmuramoyl-pentapeptide-transferase [Clostridia bacterium]|nr:phospho-N-acetylmuramoyl-pentapeptide-transferase [Clostridia bacterium]